MRPLAFLAFTLLALTGCMRGFTPALPPSVASQVAFALVPAPVQLTSDAPAAMVDGQNDLPGVNYTPRMSPDCAGPSGSMVVAGDGAAQLDVQGSPLMFLVAAIGTPPAACTLTVSGSDGSSADVQVTYETVTVIQQDGTRVRAPQSRVQITPGVTPASIAFTQADQTQTIDASGFTGAVTEKTSCTGSGGVSVNPSTFTGSGALIVMPYGQGALGGSCTVKFTDAAGGTASVNVTLGTKALKKFTLAPASVQFSCSGSPPQSCRTSQTVTLSETGAQQFKIVTRPGLKSSCANAFEGPLTMTTGNGTYALSVSGPQASVTFAGLLPSTSLNCSKIVLSDGGSPAQTLAVSVNPQIAGGAPAPTAPSCSGADPNVAVPGAPHGLYVWNPYEVQGGNYKSEIEDKVIGKDPTLCGASLLVNWKQVEGQRGVFNWNLVEYQAKPYVQAGLRVNLLFVDAAETQNGDATPDWVYSDGVQKIQCSGQPVYPNFIDPVFEADWESFITKAVQYFSSSGAGHSSIAPNVGYMRFGIGMGTEALPGHIDKPDCYNEWTSVAGWTYQKWQTHSMNIINYLGQQQTDKQLMIAMNDIPYNPDTSKTGFYDYSNALARNAAPLGIGFGTENLGIGQVADPGASPAACNPSAANVNLYWCQAFTRHVGQAPFEFQPIGATTPDSTAVNGSGKPYMLDIANLLQYALDNNAQILELYPQEWVAADDPSFIAVLTGKTVSAQESAENRAALDTASLVLGRSQ